MFLGGTFYCCMATAVGRHISIVHNQKLWKTYIRLVMCIALVVFCIIGKLYYQCDYTIYSNDMLLYIVMICYYMW